MTEIVLSGTLSFNSTQSNDLLVIRILQRYKRCMSIERLNILTECESTHSILFCFCFSFSYFLLKLNTKSVHVHGAFKTCLMHVDLTPCLSTLFVYIHVPVALFAFCCLFVSFLLRLLLFVNVIFKDHNA